MKRFGGLEVLLMAGLCGGAVCACAAPEDLDPLVLAEAENKYFATTATNPPAPPPGTPPTSTTPPVAPPPGSTPPATPPTATVPPVAPPPAPPFAAPALGGAATPGDVVEPEDAIPLEQWLNQ